MFILDDFEENTSTIRFQKNENVENTNFERPDSRNLDRKEVVLFPTLFRGGAFFFPHHRAFGLPHIPETRSEYKSIGCKVKVNAMAIVYRQNSPAV